MKKVTLKIENLRESLSRTLDEELSFGRTPLANVVLDDEGLSRVNTTIFRDGDDVLIVDENSTNGTFINGEEVSGAPKPLKDGDEITIGNHTKIFVEIRDAQSGNASVSVNPNPPTKPKDKIEKPINTQPTEKKNIPTILIAAVGACLLIVLTALIAVFLIPDSGGKSTNTKTNSSIVPSSDLVIPVRVIDPLGGQDPEDLDDFVKSWESEEDPLKAEDIEEIKTVITTDPSDPNKPVDNKPSDLIVSRAFWQEKLNLALNHSGVDEPLRVTSAMGGGVRRQSAKLGEMITQGIYKQPMDFADLAELRLKGALVELPIAKDSYVLDVGGSAGKEEFTSFDWDSGSKPLTPGMPKYEIIKRLADNFDGEKYDLNNPDHRKNIRMRLLRMYNANSRPVLEKLCEAYYQAFKVPLRITSLTRSMDYQISLNKTNSNSFRAGKGSLPPHTSGCAFDLSRKNLHTSEQNFLMQKFAEMEQTNAGDSIIEGNVNACFHTFIFPDGRPPGSAPSKPPPSPSPNAKPSPSAKPSPNAKPTSAGKR